MRNVEDMTIEEWQQHAAELLGDLTAVEVERDRLKAENEALRQDAERYRFVSELAWYVEAAARTYNLCNINARWSDQRGNPDRDDVEQRIDRERTGEADPEEDGYT